MTFKPYTESELDLEGIWQYKTKTWSDQRAIKYIDDIGIIRILHENVDIEEWLE